MIKVRSFGAFELVSFPCIGHLYHKHIEVLLCQQTMYLVNVLALFYQGVLAHFSTICLPVKHGGTGR